MICKNYLLEILDVKSKYEEEIDKALIHAIDYDKLEVKFFFLGGRPITDFDKEELTKLFETYTREGYFCEYHNDYILLYWEP